MHPGIIAARGIAKFVVGHSVTHVMVKTIKNNVAVPEKRRDTIRLAIAAYAISGMVADQASQWVGKEIDELVVWCKERKEAWDNPNPIPAKDKGPDMTDNKAAFEMPTD